MNLFEKKALIKEFGLSWLNKDLDFANIEFFVKKLDESLLYFTPQNYSWSGSCGDSETKDTVYVSFGENLNKIDIRENYESGSNYAHSSKVVVKGETILEWFFRTEQEREPVLIVVDRYDYSNWGQSSDCNDRTIFIYKSSKSSPLFVDAVKRAIEEATSKLLEYNNF